MDSEGPDHQKTFFATAKREPFGHSENCVLSCTVRGQAIGYGRGYSIRTAKQGAADGALRYLTSLPANHSLFGTQQP